MLLRFMSAIVYLAIVGYLCNKGWKRSQTSIDYIVAGRRTHPFAMAVSYAAIFANASIIIGFGGAAAVFGFTLMWLTFLNIVVGVFIAFIVFGKRVRCMGLALDAYTFPEILGQRYQSRFIQAFAGLVIFFFIPIYSAAVLIGISRLIEAYLHIPYAIGLISFSLILVLYIIMGGLKTVMDTDAMQGIFVFTILVILCIWTYRFFGGIIPAHQALTTITPMVPEYLAQGGHMGWTAGIRFGTPLWLIVYSTLIFGMGIGVLVQPQLVVRFLTARSSRDLNRSVAVAGVLILAMTGAAFTVGALSNAVSVQSFGMISIARAGGNVDMIIPIYIDTMVPWWLGALFFVGGVAASIPALSAQYHVGGTSLGRDFYGRGLGLKGAGELFAAKVGVVLTIIATILWGLVLPPNSIITATAFFFGLCAASFLPIYSLGLFWRGVTKVGALISMLGGFSISFLWLIFVHYKGSIILGICETLFRKPNLVADYPTMSLIWKLQYIDPAIIALPISFALCIMVSRITKRMPKNHLMVCFKYIK